MWLLEKRKLHVTVGLYLALIGICDGTSQVNQLSQGTLKFDPQNNHAHKNAPVGKPEISLSSSQLDKFNQATSHGQKSEVAGKQNSDSFHVDMGSQKGNKATTPTSEHQIPHNIIRSHQDTSDHQLPLPTDATDAEIPLVEDGLYWSREVEKLLPQGLTNEQYIAWTSKVARLPVIYMENGTLSRCGRDGNAYAILSDGTKACVRHSKHGNSGLLGELYAFHLSRVLQIHNVPAIALSKISTNEKSTWAGQRSQMEALSWADGNYVALIQWIPGLTEAHFPPMIQNEPHSLRANDHSMKELDTSSKVTLVGWTDLVIFDFITAHIDRMTIIYDAIRKTGEKWLMRSAIHNLARNKETGELCIFDNECAFFASYPVIVNRAFGRNISEMYDEILGSVCVFRRSTVEAVKRLADMNDIGEFLKEKLKEDQTTAKFLKEAFNDTVMLIGKIKERVEKVLAHIQKCQELGGGGF